MLGVAPVPGLVYVSQCAAWRLRMSKASMAPNRALPISGLNATTTAWCSYTPQRRRTPRCAATPNANLILTLPPLVLTALDGVAKRLV
jgi:hypothetical protein